MRSGISPMSKSRDRCQVPDSRAWQRQMSAPTESAHFREFSSLLSASPRSGTAPAVARPPGDQPANAPGPRARFGYVPSTLGQRGSRRLAAGVAAMSSRRNIRAIATQHSASRWFDFVPRTTVHARSADTTRSPTTKLRGVNPLLLRRSEAMHIARRFSRLIIGLLALVGIVGSPPSGHAGTPNPAVNAACPREAVFYNPGNGEDIVVPEGYKVEVFAKDLNFPSGIAFRGSKGTFQVFVLESGHGLPSRCNDNVPQLPLNPNVFGGAFSSSNPMTPDIVVFDNKGNKIAGPIGKPTPSGGGFQPDGPAIDLAFEEGGGRLFVTDSNAAIRTAGAANNTSRIVTVDPKTGQVTPFITGLPTGDHPAEQLAFKGGFIYWSQGSTTNAGVVG